MTKREFYERFRGEDKVTLDDLDSLIDEEELYDDIDLFNYDRFSDWVWETIHNWCGDISELKDWLSRQELTDWHISKYGEEPEPICDNDAEVNSLLEQIEEMLEDTCSDWLDEIPGDRDTCDLENESFKFNISELIY